MKRNVSTHTIITVPLVRIFDQTNSDKVGKRYYDKHDLSLAQAKTKKNGFG